MVSDEVEVATMRRHAPERGVDVDIDDVLASLDLVPTKALEDELYERLVDLLLERIVVGLTSAAVDGRMSRALYAHEIRKLADQCRRAGLFGAELRKPE
jgi:hypothetical protein